MLQRSNSRLAPRGRQRLVELVRAGVEKTLKEVEEETGVKLEIPIGERYCQLVFQTMSSPSEKSYETRSGHYQGQTGVTLRPKDLPPQA